MEHAQQSHGGPKLYTAVLGGLVTLTVLTVVAAGINFGMTDMAGQSDSAHEKTGATYRPHRQGIAGFSRGTAKE